MRSFALYALVLSLFCGSASFSAPAAKKPAKPAPQKAPAKPAPAKPTAQLPGDNGVFGTVYTLRKSDPIYFRLKSAEFTTEQLKIGERLYIPRASEKLLVLRFTVQNPSKAEQYIRWDSLRFTAVDVMNVNHECITDWGDEKNRGSVDMTFKPTQTLDAFSAVIVPARGVIPKLMILPPDENDGPILRYDLKNPKNKVTPLAKPVADPSDASGCTALETVPGELNKIYPYADFDIAVQKFETVESALGKAELEEGERFLVVTLLMKNESHEKPMLRWDTVEPMLTSTEGEELTYVDMLLATANRPIGKTANPGEETTVRMLFRIPEEVTPKTLSLREGESRTYEFSVK